MAWVKIDDQFPDHPKLAQCGPLGMALQVAGLCYCNRFLTDGFIPAGVAVRLISFEGLAQPEEVIERLVRAGVWEEVEGGYYIHDYLEYQPSRAQVEATRQQRAEAGRKGGQAKAKQNAKQNAGNVLSKTEAKFNPDPDPVPDPDPLPTDRQTEGAREAWADEPGAPGRSVGQGESGGDLPEPDDGMSLHDVIRRYNARIGIMGPSIFSDMKEWHEEHGLSAGVLVTAIDKTAEARAENRIRGSTDNYLRGVIRGLYNDGVRTVADMHARARADPRSPDYDWDAAIDRAVAAAEEVMARDS